MCFSNVDKTSKFQFKAFKIIYFLSEKTTSSQEKNCKKLVTGDLETPETENILAENLVACLSKSLKIQLKILTRLNCPSEKIMSDLAKILVENQKEMLKVIAVKIYG